MRYQIINRTENSVNLYSEPIPTGTICLEPGEAAEISHDDEKKTFQDVIEFTTDAIIVRDNGSPLSIIEIRKVSRAWDL
jgi:hypothetical protein